MTTPGPSRRTNYSESLSAWGSWAALQAQSSLPRSGCEREILQRGSFAEAGLRRRGAAIRIRRTSKRSPPLQGMALRTKTRSTPADPDLAATGSWFRRRSKSPTTGPAPRPRIPAATDLRRDGRRRRCQGRRRVKHAADGTPPFAKFSPRGPKKSGSAGIRVARDSRTPSLTRASPARSQGFRPSQLATKKWDGISIHMPCT